MSAKIAKLAGRDDEQAQESLKLLLMRRAELLNKAANKIVELSRLIEASDHIEHTLFYCAPGQIDVFEMLPIEKFTKIHLFERVNYDSCNSAP